MVREPTFSVGTAFLMINAVMRHANVARSHVDHGEPASPPGIAGHARVKGDMNLSFGIFTLNGELDDAVHSDAAITPDPEEIVRLFAASVDTPVRMSGG